MRIDSSIIGMESARRYSSSTVRTSRFLVKDYNGNAAHGMADTFGNLLNPGTGEEMAPEEGNTTENAGEGNMTSTDAVTSLRERVESLRNNRISLRSSGISTAESFRQSTIRYIFSMLFGENKAERFFGSSNENFFLNDSSNMQASSGNVLTLSSEQLYQESESTSFSAKGIVRTADGREISINVDVSMSRSFTQYFQEELQIAQVNTCDPLVLNFDGSAAELTDQKFFFDIDGDGKEDEVSMLEGGSGYLALDKNGDGHINDGKELFGPKSGSGFNDLAAYDEDGNGWIDENDAIWSKLKIWCKNEDGTDSLYTLSDKGVGAVCLQNATTDFALNGAGNQTNGYIRNTGIFLYENGNVGTVQHLDVAK
ncbi:MAG: hypothetical protein UFG06_01200 [Lachnospiraceae bacterium]|nr:hypothetical protein [Lachnospiraceae bacterium]